MCVSWEFSDISVSRTCFCEMSRKSKNTAELRIHLAMIHSDVHIWPVQPSSPFLSPLFCKSIAIARSSYLSSNQLKMHCAQFKCKNCKALFFVRHKQLNSEDVLWSNFTAVASTTRSPCERMNHKKFIRDCLEESFFDMHFKSQNEPLQNYLHRLFRKTPRFSVSQQLLAVN